MRIFYYLFVPPGPPVLYHPMYIDLHRGAMEAARGHGAELTTAPPGFDFATWVEKGEWRRYDGALGTVPFRATRSLSAWDSLQGLLPCINLCGGSTRPGALFVRGAERAGMDSLVEHLARIGHRRLAYLGIEEGAPAEERYLGFLAAVKKRGLESPAAWVASACQSAQARHSHPPRLDPLGRSLSTTRWSERAPAALAWWLSREKGRRPSALVCESDRVGCLAHQACVRLGVRVPQDLALTAFDDVPNEMQPWGYSILTNYRIDYRLLAYCAVVRLLSWLERGGPGRPGPLELPGTLVIRRSTQMEAQPLPSAGSAARFRRLALEFLESGDGEREVVNRLAAALGTKGASASARFRREFGMPLREALARRRIQRAALLLRQTQGSITEIYTGLGFHNHQTFVKFFKRYQGCTPQAWRRGGRRKPGG